jgi:hypothetical protein
MGLQLLHKRFADTAEAGIRGNVVQSDLPGVIHRRDAQYRTHLLRHDHMAFHYPLRDILDCLVRQPFPHKDLIPAVIGMAKFGYRSPKDRARLRRVLNAGLADVQ